MNQRFALTLLLAAALLTGGTADARDAPARDAAIVGYLEGVAATSGAPSISVAVGLGDEIVFSGAVGSADIEAARLASPDTVYRTGSIAKVMTTVAVMRLVEEGVLRLDDPVARFLPEHPPEQGRVTIEQLLTHTSGIRHYEPRDFWPGGPLAPAFEDATRALVIFRDQPLLFEPGTAYQYSTYGFTLLEAALEAATGTPFGDTMRALVWAPAGMARTGLELESRTVREMAVGYSKAAKLADARPVGAHNVSYKHAGGGMLSTPTDLVRFQQAILSGALLSQNSRDVMFEVRQPDLHDSQALGWRVEQRDGRRVVHMGGTISGFRSFIVAWPESGLSVAVMANQTGFEHREDVAYELGRIVEAGD